MSTRVQPIADKLGLEISSVVNLPIRKKIYTMNRSPHVFSKSKESFELRTFSKVVKFSKNTGSIVNLLKFEKLITTNLVSGLSFSIKYN